MAYYEGIKLDIDAVLDLSKLKFGDRIPVTFEYSPGEDPYIYGFRVFIDAIKIDLADILDNIKIGFNIPIAGEVYTNYVGAAIKIGMDDILSQLKQGFNMPIAGEQYTNFTGMSEKLMFKKWSFRY